MKEQITNLIDGIWVEREINPCEITTRRLAIIYLSEHCSDNKSKWLDSMYDCYRWINNLVMNNPESQGLNFEYKIFFKTSDPHTVISIIGSEFKFWNDFHHFSK